ncbi:DUF6891 domain-containing protein [Streptomyces tendae]
MLEIKVETENWQHHVRVSAEELDGLVRRIGDDGDRFLVVQRIPDLPDVFAQVWHQAGGAYTVEHRDGAADRHFQATADTPEAVAAALTGWARRQPGWDQDLTWSRLDMGSVQDVPFGAGGIAAGSSETTEAIGHEIVAALEAVGLHTEWDGDPGRAITVTPLDWRRRLVG